MRETLIRLFSKDLTSFSFVIFLMFYLGYLGITGLMLMNYKKKKEGAIPHYFKYFRFYKKKLIDSVVSKTEKRFYERCNQLFIVFVTIIGISYIIYIIGIYKNG